MAVQPWNTFSRLEMTSIDDLETTRAVVMRVTPPKAISQVDTIDAQTSVPTSGPITLSDAHARLSEAVTWQALEGADPWNEYGRFELRAFENEVFVIVVSQVDGVATPSEEYQISGEVGGPWPLSVAQTMLQNAHARVVEAKNP